MSTYAALKNTAFFTAVNVFPLSESFRRSSHGNRSCCRAAACYPARLTQTIGSNRPGPLRQIGRPHRKHRFQHRLHHRGRRRNPKPHGRMAFFRFRKAWKRSAAGRLPRCFSRSGTPACASFPLILPEIDRLRGVKLRKAVSPHNPEAPAAPVRPCRTRQLKPGDEQRRAGTVRFDQRQRRLFPEGGKPAQQTDRPHTRPGISAHAPPPNCRPAAENPR